MHPRDATQPLRVVIIDDHPISRCAYGAELDGYPFIAKADMCRAALVEVIASAESWCPDRD